MDSWRFFFLIVLVLPFDNLFTCDADQFVQSTDGGVAKCVEKKRQIAFSHHLLQNHKLQERPSQIPKITGTRKKSKWETLEAQVTTAKCPEGMIPVQQIGATLRLHKKPIRRNINTSVILQHEYGEVGTGGLQKLYGTRAILNVWSPTIEDKKSEESISQIWIVSGGYEKNDLNTVEVGWQVCPEIYKDNRPRLFTYWTSDSYQFTGRYNLQDAGFIQVNTSIVLGGAISPVSSVGGTQFEITILVWKDPKSRNWWLSLGPDYSLVGYWPAELYTSLSDHATQIDWGGEIINSLAFGRHTKTEMGSGHFPEEGFGKASYIRNLEVLDKDRKFQAIRKLDNHADGTYYKVQNFSTDDWGTHFFFGGPGFTETHSGVVTLGLSSFYICLCIIFYIII